MSGEDEWRWTSNVMVVAVVDMLHTKKRIFLHRRKEKRECQIFPRSRQGCSPTSNIFPSRPLSRSAAFRVNTKTSESIDHNQPLRPPLPNNSFNYRVGGTGVRAMSGRNVLAVALGTYACFALRAIGVDATFMTDRTRCLHAHLFHYLEVSWH